MDDVGCAHDHREAKRNQTIDAADGEPADYKVDELGKAESTHYVHLAGTGRGSPAPFESAGQRG
jgi:hypothetical protein